MSIDTAFILAAGKGTRMAPLTDIVPKPLVKLNGRALLDYVFDHLKDAGVTKAVVNSHHHAGVLRKYLAGVQGIEIMETHELVLLETGGGLQNAASYLGDEPFFMINGDAFWTDGPSGCALKRLEDFFDDERMDILLLLIPVERMILTEGVGDYDLLPDGQIRRNKAKAGTHMFTGIRIVHPRILSGMEEGIYSFLKQMDAAEQAGRLYGLVHDGEWHHISTPDDLKRVGNACRDA
ncbi:MAG TPA: nucleotidyltransferase family protein [Alphaproteobacteria bacterium]|nr:nucleotidyltransferase family protein [Alphaproteobacteria bacterium]HNS43936.1 nucleotidyltransferase family protein [Alphaproteobacteria bacterium]